MKSIMILITVCLCLAFTCGCDDSSEPSGSSDPSAESVPSGSGLVLAETYNEVEIAPDTWLKVKEYYYLYETDYKKDKVDPHNITINEALQQIKDTAMTVAAKSLNNSEQSGFHFTWNDIEVKWQGYEIPVSLREFEGSLYMIGYNREDLNNQKLVYFRLNDKGNGFIVIDAKDYPKQIATQNLWLQKYYRYITPDKYDKNTWKHLSVLDESDPLYFEPIDTLKLLRELDVEHPAFYASGFTESIWVELEKNVSLQEQEDKRPVYNGDQKFLLEFKNKYNPIALPTIIKENENENE